MSSLESCQQLGREASRGESWREAAGQAGQAASRAGKLKRGQRTDNVGPKEKDVFALLIICSDGDRLGVGGAIAVHGDGAVGVGVFIVGRGLGIAVASRTSSGRSGRHFGTMSEGYDTGRLMYNCRCVEGSCRRSMGTPGDSVYRKQGAVVCGSGSSVWR